MPRSLFTFCCAVAGVFSTTTAIGQGKLVHGTGFVALAGAPRRPALNTSVLICAFDEKVLELVPQLHASCRS